MILLPFGFQMSCLTRVVAVCCVLYVLCVFYVCVLCVFYVCFMCALCVLLCVAVCCCVLLCVALVAVSIIFQRRMTKMSELDILKHDVSVCLYTFETMSYIVSFYVPDFYTD